MPFLAPAIPAIIGVGGSLLSGLLGSKAAKGAGQTISAGDIQAATGIGDAARHAQQFISGNVQNAQDWSGAATDQANQSIRDAMSQIVNLYAPYRDTGAASLQSIQDLAGATGPLAQQFAFNPSDLSKDPGYAFTLGEGQKAINRSAAAQGNVFSGGTLKSLAGYTEGTANQYFNDAFNRSLSTFSTNRQSALSRISTLQGLANLGYGATSGTAGAVQTAGVLPGENLISGARYAGNVGLEGAQLGGNIEMRGAEDIGNWLTQAANARAAGSVGATNQWQNTIGTTGSILADYIARRQANKQPNVWQGGYSVPWQGPTQGGP